MKPRTSRRLAIAAMGVIILGLAGLYLNYRLNLRPVGRGQAVAFTVATGQSAPAVGRSLQQAGLIRSKNAFVTYVNLHDLRSRLKAGNYSISPEDSTGEIAEILADGRTSINRLVVPEGYTIKQIEKLASQRGISTGDFEAALASPHGQSFLAGKPAGVSLEGYLFPDSYQVNTTTTANQLVNTMLDDFSQRVGPEYTQAFAAEGLTLHQGLTLASIIEREVSNASDRPVVAQIFLKRLRIGMPLGSDVTTEYAASLLGVPFNIDLNSPYNTRKVTGLPPGPICNPGLSSLDAAAKPAQTDYLYFLAGKDGKTHFAKTYAEHQSNIAKYLQ